MLPKHDDMKLGSASIVGDSGLLHQAHFVLSWIGPRIDCIRLEDLADIDFTDDNSFSFSSYMFAPLNCGHRGVLGQNDVKTAN